MKRFDDLLEFIGANKKIEILKISIFNILVISMFVVLVVLLKQLLFIFAGLIALGGLNYFLFNSYLEKKKSIINDREHEFVTMIGYFQFFICNRYNVYQAFQSLLAYASPWMEEQIHCLILEIDNDKSLKPFINFASKFQTKVASNVMVSIYQMVDQGEDNAHMIQFNSIFEQLSKNKQKELIDKKDRSLSSLATLPLIGAGAITVLLTFGIISIMGEMVNVL